MGTECELTASMHALTVVPGREGSTALVDVPEPDISAGSLLVRTLAVGICGTDAEIVAGRYGWAPAGRERLTIGHESLGEVIEAPHASGFLPEDTAAPSRHRSNQTQLRHGPRTIEWHVVSLSTIQAGARPLCCQRSTYKVFDPQTRDLPSAQGTYAQSHL